MGTESTARNEGDRQIQKPNPCNRGSAGRDLLRDHRVSEGGLEHQSPLSAGSARERGASCTCRKPVIPTFIRIIGGSYDNQ